MAQNDIYIYTMNQGGLRGKWSRYRWDYIVEHFAHLRDALFTRSGDTVYEVIEFELYDDGVPFTSVLQWPWLDWGEPGVTKMLNGFDLVGEGTVSAQIGYDQTNLEAFTTEFTLPGDTYTGGIIPLPMSAPTMSLKLTYSSETNWEWNAGQMYVQDFARGK